MTQFIDFCLIRFVGREVYANQKLVPVMGHSPIHLAKKKLKDYFSTNDALRPSIWPISNAGQADQAVL